MKPEPKPFKDIIPSTSLLHGETASPGSPFGGSSPLSSPPASPTEARPEYRIAPDEFGLSRVYYQQPSLDPAENFNLYAATDFPLSSADNIPERSPFSGFGPQAGSLTADTRISSLNPFPNISVFRLMKWFYSVRRKSLDNLTSLVRDVISPADFEQQHFHNFNAQTQAKHMDAYIAAEQQAAIDQPLPWNSADGWKKTSVTLQLPRARKRSETEEDIPQMTVEGVRYRDVAEVIKAAFQGDQAWDFHLKPFKLMWKPYSDEPEIRVHGETFWTDRMIDMDNNLPKIPGCNLERVAVPIQLWSDSTHLTAFGTQKMWPIYLYLGNLSKYIRGRPSTFSANHIAYIPSVSNFYLSS
jgi:hypothetical protein